MTPDAESKTRTEPATPRRRGSYGIDAPYAPAFMALMTLLEIVVAVISGKVWVWLAPLIIPPAEGSVGGSGGADPGGQPVS